MKKLIPDYYYTSIFDIDIEILLKKNIKYLIIDLDNTLVAWDCPKPTERVEEWLQMLASKNIQVCLTSNNHKERVEIFVHDLDIKYIYEAKKPLKIGFNRAMDKLGAEKQRVACIGDQLFTDVLGGNNLGLVTVLVDPIANKEFAWTMFVRKIESHFRKKLKKTS